MMAVRASKADWLAPGCRLDRYDLLLQVAEGGMGLLWLARQQGKHGFDKIVAIKTILPKLASDAAFRQMFLDEARVVSRIEHPNVAQVLDLGEERGVLFLVMKWIEGETLIHVGRAVARQTRGQIPVGILARIMVDACAGLHAAHELSDDEGLSLGVVHRDVSPHNLLVGFGGTTKVIDFGIAKARNRIAQDTSIGLLKGKIAYMAPEQAMGSEVDRRTDIWSAAASMYRFLAGQVPYDAGEPVAVLRRIAQGLPPPPLPTSVPEPIRMVVERALEPDARKRFETAHDMGAALEAAMHAADMYTTHEDVASFMAKHLGEARAVHTREIEQAVRESRARMQVELAHAESESAMALPTPWNDENGESAQLPAKRWDASVRPESGSDGPARPSRQPTVESRSDGASRPSRQPTAESHFDGASRPSRHPTVALPTSQSSIGACAVPQTLPKEAADPGEGSGGARAASAALIQGPGRAPRRVARPVVRWIAATGLLCALLGGGFAWRASLPSSTIGPAAAAASPIGVHGVPTVDTATVPALGPSVADAALSTLDPQAPVTVSSHPAEPRALATPPTELNAPDRGPADDLLERAHRARRAGRIGEAAALFAAAVEKEPMDSVALTGLAEVDEAQGLTAKAIAHYRRALSVNPRYLPARLGLADSLWTGGQRGEARAAYRAIVDQVPATLCPELARERAAGNGGNEGTPK